MRAKRPIPFERELALLLLGVAFSFLFGAVICGVRGLHAVVVQSDLVQLQKSFLAAIVDVQLATIVAELAGNCSVVGDPLPSRFLKIRSERRQNRMVYSYS